MSSQTKQILATCVPFGLFMGAFWTFFSHVPIGSAIVMASVAGLLFGLLMTNFANSSYLKQTTRPILEPAERVIYETPANHFKGLEGVGGWLFLTDQRVIFKSHSFNFQNHELSLLLSEIVNVKVSRTLGIIPNGLLIQAERGQPERFVVMTPQDWVKHITAKKRH